MQKCYQRLLHKKLSKKKIFDMNSFNVYCASKSTMKTIFITEILNNNVIKGLVSPVKDKDFSNLDCFHRSIAPVLFVSQLFALMPLLGVLNPNPNKVKFEIISLPVLGTFLFLICATFLIFSFMDDLFDVGVNPKNTVGIVFFTCGISACVLFFRLATKWPQLIQYWSNTELVFLRYPYEIPKTKLSTKIRISSLIIVILSIFEHGTYFISITYSFIQHWQICNTTNSNFEEFMVTNYHYVFRRVNYSFLFSIIILVLNGIFTLIWNYLDLFIALVSFGIAIRFEQLNVRILKLVKQKPSEEIWSEIREHYVKICDLTEVVDQHLSPIIVLSSLNNLYFICYQLLNIFNKLRWSINYLYFWYSLLFLIGRTIFVFMSAATINDASKKSLKELRKIPTSIWCIEVERLTNQISTQCVALSGMQFFFLTRKLLFGMAGTIVTYELVLLQFDESSRKQSLPPLCA